MKANKAIFITRQTNIRFFRTSPDSWRTLDVNRYKAIFYGEEK